MQPYAGLQRNPSTEVPLTCVPDEYYDAPVLLPSNVIAQYNLNDATYTNSGTGVVSSARAGFGYVAAPAKFGAGSGAGALVDNGLSYGVFILTSGAFNFGTGQFCFEAWVYKTLPKYGILCEHNNVSLTGAAGLFIEINGSQIVGAGQANGAYVVVGTGSPITLNRWTHIAVYRIGVTWYLTIDGAIVATGTSSANLTATGPMWVMGIDRSGRAAGTMLGYIDDLRICNASPYAASDFDVPTNEFALPLWQHTILSLHGESIVDSSSDPKALSNQGATISSTQFQFGVSALAFDGTSQYLKQSPVHADFYFESTAFTVEAWVYATAFDGKIRHVFNMSENVTGAFAYTYPLAVNATGSLQAYVQPVTGGAGVSMTSATGLIAVNEWHHIAFCRDGAYAYLFLDGVQVASSIAWVDFPAAKTQHIAIGAVGNGYTDGTVGTWKGYIDDLRVTRGVARYAPQFAVPTEAFPDAAPADPHFDHVTLLLHMDGSDGGTTFTDSSSSAKTPSTVFGVSTSTDQIQFGPTAGKFTSTASGASLRYGSSADFDFPGDFTIECWAYYLGGGGYARMIATRRVYDNIGAGTWRWGIGGWQSLESGAFQVVSHVNPINVWHHVAISRSGGVMRAFLNGVLVSSATDTRNYSNTEQLVIGHDRDGPGEFTPFGGYIDDLRITKGVGRYTGSFTPPALTFCDFQGTDAPPVVAPLPPPSPMPGSADFAVAAVSPVDFTISTAISPARTLATITTAETSVAILASASVPGVTFNVVGSPVTSITATGTPTTAGRTRLVLTYVRNDGTGVVLGGSAHDVRVIDPAVLFTVGPCANLSARVGEYVDVVLCSPSIALNLPTVMAYPDRNMQTDLSWAGFSPSSQLIGFTWTPGASSTGVLRARGVVGPTSLGAYTLTVTYRANGWPLDVLGTSTHQVVITPAYTPAPPAPAPAPAPTPPTPAPVPSPPAAPAPSPLPSADPLFSSVLLLHRFNTADAIIVEDRASGWRSIVGPNLRGLTDEGPGAAGEAAALNGGTGLQCTATDAMVASTTALTVECFVDIDEATGLWASGTDNRYTPLVSIVNPGNELVWTLGLTSYDAGDLGRFVSLMAWRASPNNHPLGATAYPQWSMANSIPIPPGRFVHAAGQWSAASPRRIGAWWDGRGGALVDVLEPGATGVALRAGADLIVGGSCPQPRALNTGWNIRPLIGRVDELRITAAERYDLSGVATEPISAAARTIPFAGY